MISYGSKYLQDRVGHQWAGWCWFWVALHGLGQVNGWPHVEAGQDDATYS